MVLGVVAAAVLVVALASAGVAVVLYRAAPDMESMSMARYVLGGSIIAIVWCLLVMPICIAAQRVHEDIAAVASMCITSIFIPPLWFVALCWAYMGRRQAAS